MKQIIHFRSTEERLAFLKGEMKEIIPQKAAEKKAPKKKPAKSKKSAKKENK